MFIELTEILRCPRDHDQAYLVAAPMAMDGRRIVRGALGCPVCRAEFPIVDAVAYFGAPAARAAAAPAPGPAYDAAALGAFLDLGGPGGYVLLVGAAARLAPAAVTAVPGVHFVAVNPPREVAPEPMLSILVSPRGVPLRTASVRGAAVGADHAAAPWIAEAVRALLPGRRLVVDDERAGSGGVTELARGAGVLVGEKPRA